MKIPKTIKICGLNYKVQMEKDIQSKEGIVGQHHPKTLIIRLHTNNYHQEKLEQNFFHEIFHAIDSNYNNDSLDEETIERLANGIYQVLKDNNLLK